MWFPPSGGAERTLGEESEGLGPVSPRWMILTFVDKGTSFCKASPRPGQVWVKSQPDQVDMYAGTQACSAPQSSPVSEALGGI